MSAPPPVFPRIFPDTYKAELYRREGVGSWLVRWKVRRSRGIANLESEWRHFIFRRSAERVAHRWVQKNQVKPDQLVKKY
jgi:hypothetical protein